MSCAAAILRCFRLGQPKTPFISSSPWESELPYRQAVLLVNAGPVRRPRVRVPSACYPPASVLAGRSPDENLTTAHLRRAGLSERSSSSMLCVDAFEGRCRLMFAHTSLKALVSCWC